MAEWEEPPSWLRSPGVRLGWDKRVAEEPLSEEAISGGLRRCGCRSEEGPTRLGLGQMVTRAARLESPVGLHQRGTRRPTPQS